MLDNPLNQSETKNTQAVIPEKQKEAKTVEDPDIFHPYSVPYGELLKLGVVRRDVFL